jgi:UDP-N-acetyl-D-glucosamine dehydrogenase
MQIAIVGLGYVGLPLAVQFARSGASVIGLDVDPAKTEAINAGHSYIRHIPAATIAEQVAVGRLHASTDFAKAREADAVLICVPTPLGRNREPDLAYILNTGKALAPHLRRGALVVLESTTYPGTTENELRPVLEKGSGLTAGVDFHLAYSPEREDPGNPDSRVAEIPKVVGGLTPACLEKALAVYGRAIQQLVPVSSCRVAEASKLTENIFRCVNIAMVNELKIVYAAMGIDIWEVIAAAKTKPFGYMPFYPGPGLGGHCIPIDPFYLTWKAREVGQATRFIELAGEINASMPAHVVHRTMEALNDRGRALKGARILVLGLAYKADVADHRESPAFHLFDLLQQRGAEVDYHDPLIPEIGPTRDHPERAGMKSAPWTSENLRSFDAAIICTAHRAVDYADLARHVSLIIDTRNAMAPIATLPGQVWKA